MTANPHVALANAVEKPSSWTYAKLLDEVYAVRRERTELLNEVAVLRRQLDELTGGDKPACATETARRQQFVDEPIPGLLDSVEEAS